MTYELKTLSSYGDEELIEELKRVSLLVNGRLTMSKFDLFSKVHSSTVRNRFNGWSKALEKADLANKISPHAQTFSDTEIVEQAKIIANKLKTKSLTRKQFSEHSGIGERPIKRIFGSWKEVLIKANLEISPLGRRYSDEECFENILKLWVHYGRQPSYAELKQSPSKVGAKAYVGRWGGWKNALKAFIEYSSKEIKNTKKITISPEAKETVKELPHRGKSRSINLALRYKVLVRDNFRCVICGRSPAVDLGTKLHIDHIVAWSKGGLNELSNLRVLCSDCNLGKGDKDENLL